MDEVYVVFTNSDLTEGRGRPVPLYVCEMLTTALRVAKGHGVMGSDASVLTIKCLDSGGVKYIPLNCINLIKPSYEDEANEQKRTRKEEAIMKAMELGLSKEDIEALK